MGVWKSRKRPEEPDLALMPRFTRAGMVEVPKDRLPDGEMLPQTAYQIVLDEVMLDGNARFNLATFVTTWMDEEADRLYAATFDKNMVDKDEYPQTAEIEARCVRMLGGPVARPGRRRQRRHLDHRQLRGLHARRPGAQAAVAAAPGARPGSRPTGPTSSWAATSRWSGRSSPTTGRSSRATCRSRATSST